MPLDGPVVLPQRLPAICCMVSPSLISIRTSCSRGVSDARTSLPSRAMRANAPELAEGGSLHLGRDDPLAVQDPADLPVHRRQRGGLDQVPLDTQAQRLHDRGAVRPVGKHHDDVHQLPIVQPPDRIDPIGGQGDVQDGDVGAEFVADGQDRGSRSLTFPTTSRPGIASQDKRTARRTMGCASATNGSRRVRRPFSHPRKATPGWITRSG